MSALSARRERFAQEYASGCSGAEAARRAGYSARSATAEACRLLSKDEIRARVAELQAEAAEKIGWTRDDHLARLAAIGAAAEKSGAHGVAARCEELRGRCLGYYDSPASVPSKAKVEVISPSELKPSGSGVTFCADDLLRQTH